MVKVSILRASEPIPNFVHNNMNINFDTTVALPF